MKHTINKALAVAVLGAIAVFRLMKTHAPFLKNLSCLSSHLFCRSDGDYSRKSSSPTASRWVMHSLVASHIPMPLNQQSVGKLLQQ